MDQGFCGNLRQDDGTHAASQENEEVPFCSPELSDDKLADISANYVQKAEDLEEMVRDAMGFDECTEAELKKLKRLVADMKTPLYQSCKENYTKLFATLKLLQLKARHHWTDRSFNELLHLLEDMLPERNELPKTTYEAKQIVCPMGLEVEKIHACKNDCILYRGDNAELTECPECGTSRYKRRNDRGDEDKRHGAPQKVAWYFPIIPRLKRLFATAKDAQLLSWHKEGHKIDDYLRFFSVWAGNLAGPK
jgi:Zn ribbon nucleic-acid-binding protein